MATFKDFIMRGNVVDLAVGVVIGAAFNGVVTAFTNSFINPMIKLATGGVQQGVLKGGKFTLAGVDFTYGDFVSVILNFVITAAVVYYLVVVPMNTLREMQLAKAKAAQPDQAPPPSLTLDQELLKEIRDLLKAQQGSVAVLTETERKPL
ncbi:large conductance mechanosensitive channel protein MscL [Deinococcus cellulosilyticus]|uniref:Large-conductance mechanosensitive channel n=1 Tax=Deinococcus cellulosilyticus (strain DSM 18568 / NBRC 106333 / KACC 11606 / 5516J-15) TaxID=1223518 RepID=A0A511MZQ2_DEIC1|nr:large conductance mechanosensitive channel protein MscL [Deinococcus cellulosilyticus]GEM45801.1 large-conductance mechanosensitive channel [Deinococcus cellulosilyticus NBRC 106333 = KACC 11606]